MKEKGWKPYHLLSEPPTSALSEWLLHAGSFMQRLVQHGVQGQVHVLNQSWQFPTAGERALLGIKERTYALVREVFIDSSAGKWMFARTVLPAPTLTGKERELANLKNRSLGSVLFKNKTTTRSAFEFICLQPEMSLHKKINLHFAIPEPLWTRRSVFHVKEKPLLLSEVFFPDLMALTNADT